MKCAGRTHRAEGRGIHLPGRRLGKAISDVANKKSEAVETNTDQLLAKSVQGCYAFETSRCQIIAGSPRQKPGGSGEDRRSAEICLKKARC